MQLKYHIDSEELQLNVQGDFRQSELSKVLSNESTDICFHLPWYSDGYVCESLFNEKEFSKLHDGIERVIRGKLEKFSGSSLTDFTLNKYHHFVDDEEHIKIVRETRDLFPEDFDFDVEKIHSRLAQKTGLRLTDESPYEGGKMHIIIRINRPGSEDFNPPHKDIYEHYDGAI